MKCKNCAQSMKALQQGLANLNPGEDKKALEAYHLMEKVFVENHS